MSSRFPIKPNPVIVNASMATNVTSEVTIIQNTSQVGYDISWTGTPTGTFSVQVSNTYTQNGQGIVLNPGTWTTLTLSTVPTASGSPGNGYIDLDAGSFYAVRLVYTAG